MWASSHLRPVLFRFERLQAGQAVGKPCYSPSGSPKTRAWSEKLYSHAWIEREPPRVSTAPDRPVGFDHANLNPGKLCDDYRKAVAHCVALDFVHSRRSISI